MRLLTGSGAHFRPGVCPRDPHHPTKTDKTLILKNEKNNNPKPTLKGEKKKKTKEDEDQE
jgi:hypothetical protein